MYEPAIKPIYQDCEVSENNNLIKLFFVKSGELINSILRTFVFVILLNVFLLPLCLLVFLVPEDKDCE